MELFPLCSANPPTPLSKVQSARSRNSDLLTCPYGWCDTFTGADCDLHQKYKTSVVCMAWILFAWKSRCMFQAKTWTRMCQTKWIRTGADGVSLCQDITRISNAVQCHFLAVNHSPHYRDLSFCQVLSTVSQTSGVKVQSRESSKTICSS